MPKHINLALRPVTPAQLRRLSAGPRALRDFHMTGLKRFARLGLLPLALALAAAASQASPVVDVMFLTDSSGSVGGAQFQSELALVNDIESQFVSLSATDGATYRFAVLDFDSGVTTELNFTQAYSASAVSAISYAKGASFIKSAVQGGINLFGSESGVGDIKQMFLFTNGLPDPAQQNPLPLLSTLQHDDINMTLLTETGFSDQGEIDDLVQDPARDDVAITAFTSGDTTAINTRLLASDGNAVPEPGTLSIAGLGLLGLVVARRRKTGK